MKAGTLTIPPPADGFAYKVGEIAGMLGLKKSSVHAWVARGIPRGGEMLRLETLATPRGRVLPERLKAFLAAANGCEVEIKEG